MTPPKLMLRAGVAWIAAGLILAGTACGRDVRESGGVVGPSLPPASPSSPAAVARQIQVGDAVADALIGHGSARLYEVTTPTSGTLKLRLEWARRAGLLSMKVGEEAFTSAPPDWAPPIEARLAVAAGRSYRVTVLDAAPWDYDELNLPFLLTAALE